MKPWPVLSLADIATPVVRQVPVEPGRAYRTIGVKWWGQGAYERETIDGSQTAAKTLSLVREGDLIINKIWVRHGSTAIAGADVDGCAASGEFPMFELAPARVLPGWLYWLTKTKSFWSDCDALSRGTSGKNRIKPELFLTIRIPLPPLAEQRRIVAKIDQLADKIAEARGLRESNSGAARSISASSINALCDQLRQSCATVPLGNIAEIRSGVTLGRNLAGPTISLPYLRVANVQDGRVDLRVIKTVNILAEERDKWQLQAGDVLLTEGGDWDKLGRGTVWNAEVPDCIHQNHIFRVRLDRTRYEPRFLAALTSSPYGRAYFGDASKQTTNLASINQRQLKAFPVLDLPLSEQRRTVAHLDDLQAKVDRLKELQAQSAAELDALLPAILDQAFTGEL